MSKRCLSRGWFMASTAAANRPAATGEFAAAPRERVAVRRMSDRDVACRTRRTVRRRRGRSSRAGGGEGAGVVRVTRSRTGRVRPAASRLGTSRTDDRSRRRAWSERLSHLSSGLFAPRAPITHHRVQDRQKFAHGRREGDLWQSSVSPQALIERSDHGVPPNRGDRRHVQHPAHR